MPAEGVCKHDTNSHSPAGGWLIAFMPERAIVLSNGEIGEPELLKARLEGWKDALVIGADAGSLHALSLGLTVNVVVGDFDSLDGPTGNLLKSPGIHIERAPAEKDETDLELALLHAVRRGAAQVAVLGAFGGRIDMTLANVLLLAHPDLTGARIELWHGAQTVWLLRPPGGEIAGRSGDTISLIPLAGDVTSITTHRLAYELRGGTLRFGPARGISNVMQDSTAQVAFRQGLLLVIHTPGKA